MLKRIPWWVKALIIAAALIWAATYNQPPATPAAPAAPPASTPAQDTAAPDCFHVPADGQSHPCDIPAPPVMMWTVTDHGTYHPDGDCWSLGMTLPPAPGMDGGAFMRTCVPKPDYDAHPVGSKYSTGGPGTSLSGGSATRITDGS
jgi:hypothetical protein